MNLFCVYWNKVSRFLVLFHVQNGNLMIYNEYVISKFNFFVFYIDAFHYNNEILSMEITLICQVLKGTKKVAERSNE